MEESEITYIYCVHLYGSSPKVYLMEGFDQESGRDEI